MKIPNGISTDYRYEEICQRSDWFPKLNRAEENSGIQYRFLIVQCAANVDE